MYGHPIGKSPLVQHGGVFNRIGRRDYSVGSCDTEVAANAVGDT